MVAILPAESQTTARLIGSIVLQPFLLYLFFAVFILGTPRYQAYRVLAFYIIWISYD